jgi:hypothetical protein
VHNFLHRIGILNSASSNQPIFFSSGNLPIS